MTEETVKIYEPGGEPDLLLEGERAAEEYRRERRNGNLEKAHRLGRSLAERFLATAVEGDFAPEKRVLLSYLAGNLIEEEIGNPLLQTSVWANFTETVRERAPGLAAALHDPRGITYYSLNDVRRASRSEGEILAELCHRGRDAALVEEGNTLAENFADAVRADIRAAAFV